MEVPHADMRREERNKGPERHNTQEARVLEWLEVDLEWQLMLG